VVWQCCAATTDVGARHASHRFPLIYIKDEDTLLYQLYNWNISPIMVLNIIMVVI